jgi:hypothetical protein
MSDWFRKQPKILKKVLAGYPQGPAQAPARPQAPLPNQPVRSPQPSTPAGPWQKGTSPIVLPERLQGVSAAVVRQHFVRSEIREIGKQEDAIHAAVVDKLRTIPPFSTMSDNDLQHVIAQITYRLQQSDLTINFPAAKWFSAPNTTQTYQQMWERGTFRGADLLQRMPGGNAMNKTDTRDGADTRVTFRQGVGTGQTQGIGRFMQTGGLRADGPDFVYRNQNFNPRTRQNFAALNYGRNPKGAATEYGTSHLILAERLKHNAIYYIGDTFDPGITADNRATYGMLFSLILWAKPAALTQLIRATWFGQPLTANGGDNLLEAHVYEGIGFSGGVTTMVLDRTDCSAAWSNWMFTDKSTPEPPNADGVIAHAEQFCRRHGIEMKIVSSL